MTNYNKPLPKVENEPYAKQFWESLQNEQLIVQECDECKQVQYFPRPWCRYCGSNGLHWTECTGTGTLASYTIIHNTAKSPEFADDVPYCFALIELDEGVTMYTNVVDYDGNRLEMGAPVEIVYDYVTDDVTLPKFTPRDS